MLRDRLLDRAPHSLDQLCFVALKYVNIASRNAKNQSVIVHFPDIERLPCESAEQTTRYKQQSCCEKRVWERYGASQKKAGT